jgi:hypothetical protein
MFRIVQGKPREEWCGEKGAWRLQGLEETMNWGTVAYVAKIKLGTPYINVMEHPFVRMRFWTRGMGMSVQKLIF